MGDHVHIEVDQVARYIEQLLLQEDRPGIASTVDDIRKTLESSGFLRQGSR